MKKYSVGEILKDQQTTEYSYEGYGVIRKEGYSIFVFQMLENEIADIKIIKANSKFAFAEILNLKQSNSKRIKPLDESLLKTGAAPLSILDYKDQLIFKTDVVKYLAKRQLNFENVNDILASPKQWNYRNKIVVFCDYKNNKYNIGTYKKLSHDLVTENEFYLVQEPINNVLKSIIKNINNFKDLKQNKFKNIMVRCSQNTNQIQLLFVTENNKEISKEFINKIILENHRIVSIVHNIFDFKNKSNLLGIFYKNIIGDGFIKETLNDFEFEIYWNSFFQVNTAQTLLLYSKLIENLDINKNDTVLDAYCGVGTITSFLALNSKKVIGVEIVSEAIENAKKAAQKNNIKNISFYANDIDKQINILNKENISFDIVCADPPRTGITQDFINIISDQNPRQIGYISCNPHTLIRDAVYLDKKGYKLIYLQPVDMFPQTPHIECVAVFEKS